MELAGKVQSYKGQIYILRPRTQSEVIIHLCRPNEVLMKASVEASVFTALGHSDRDIPLFVLYALSRKIQCVCVNQAEHTSSLFRVLSNMNSPLIYYLSALVVLSLWRNM